MAFTWVIKLDKKKRLVIPMEAREKLGITDYVLVKLRGRKLAISKPNGERGRPISKNCEEVSDSYGLGSVEVSTSDCGKRGCTPSNPAVFVGRGCISSNPERGLQTSGSPGANPGLSPYRKERDYED